MSQTVVPVKGQFDWPTQRSWMSSRAIDDVELVGSDSYRRTTAIGAVPAVVEVTCLPSAPTVEVKVRTLAPCDVGAVAARVTRVLDLDRDLLAMRGHFADDPFLAGALASHPTLRVPGGWDAFELAVRAVLGQQVTVRAARQLASDLVAICGSAMPVGLHALGLARLFPTAGQVAAADLGALRMPGARRATLTALARAAADDDRLFEAGGPLDDVIARLRAIKGIGEWTAHYIALRALRHPDAFPASDVGLLRGAARETGTRPTPDALLRRAERWRPCRAYAAQLLWAEDGDR
ncbi:DNA-3-methyladenine glycosylase family protein [Luteitalea pratensis]|uniref:DNA-3-methyladenine glycosylase family protein n=1 Tax=Luteitalea pratensis TaxID=1855912 RepID=UPI001390493D|nr:DNA-3-methyladenine glycosylase 2 family protein [Luteitalea pratensis]